MEEVWNDIKGFEGYYQVSNLGRVRSLDRYVKHSSGGKQLVKGKVLIQYERGKTGYMCVRLSKNNEITNYNVHRLVAEAFIPNPLNLPCVNHKDEDKTNNHVDNLEWCTYQYNNTYGTAIERRAKKHSINMLGKTNTNRSKPVIQYDLDGNVVNEFPSVAEACRVLKLDKSMIFRNINGGYFDTRFNRWYNSNTYKGFIWKYKEKG